MSTVIRGTDELTGSNDPVNITQNKLHIAQYVWDVNTLAWIRQTGSAGTGTDVTVTNLPPTQVVTGTVSLPTYAKRYDKVDETTSYLGDATVGSGQSSAVWRIQKLTFGVDGVVS